MLTTRFAPSPTGRLHLGHAYAALFAERSARRAGGRFLLRIEDIDETRCRPAFTQAIRDDLAWLGLTWEEPVRVQSAHFDDYRAVLAALAGRGLVYPCFCTRADIARGSHGQTPDGAPLYPGTCRDLPADLRAARLAEGHPHAFRLDMAKALATCPLPLSYVETGESGETGHIPCHPERFGDIVLARKACPTSYHLAVTHDDARQGVTLVTRGADLRPATDLHRLLQTLMGWPEPAYAHHRLITDDHGAKLAKTAGSAPLRALGLAVITHPLAKGANV